MLIVIFSLCLLKIPSAPAKSADFSNNAGSNPFVNCRQLLIILPERKNYPVPRIRTLEPMSIDYEQTFINHFIKINSVEVMTDMSVNMNSKEKSLNIVRAKCVLLILLAKNARQRVMEFVKNDVWNSNARVLAILEEGSLDFAKEVLETLWKRRKAINVTVRTVLDEISTYFTINPFKNNLMYKLEPHLNIFPEKIPKNFNGYAIKAGVTISAPFVMPPKEPNQYDEGIEIRAMKIIQRIFNFSVEYVSQPDGESPWIMAGPNNTVIGLFGLLDRCEADIIFHGVQLSYARCLASDCLQAHITESTHLFCPLMESFDPWIILYRGFEPVLWFSVVTTLFIVVFSTYYIAKYQNHTESREYFTWECTFLSILALYLKVGSLSKIKGAPLRVFFAAFCFYATTATIAYEGLLYSAYTNPKPATQKELLKEMVDLGLIAYLYPSGKPFYNQTDHDAWNIILTPGRHVFSDDYKNTLHIMRYNRNNFAELPKTQALHEISERHLDVHRRPLVYMSKKTTSSYLPTFFLSRGHPLTKMFQKIDSKIVEAGLYFRWIKIFVTLNQNKKKRDKELDSLSLKQTQAIFYILIFLLCMAILEFFAEIVLESTCCEPKKVGPQKRRTPFQKKLYFF